MIFAQRLAEQLRHEPGRPLVTFYDEATGERVELSVTTYANWVAKTASLLVEEHDLERGDVLRVDLPTHWLGPVFLGAAWTAGLAVSFTATDADAVVCGPSSLVTWAPHAASYPVLACALLPLGVRFAEPLPDGVHDVGVEVWSQPDAFVPYDPPTDDDVALADDGRTQGELFAAAPGLPTGSPAGTGSGSSTGADRLLTTVNPASPPGVAVATGPLVSAGSLVLVTGTDDRARLAALADAERAVLAD